MARLDGFKGSPRRLELGDAEPFVIGMAVDLVGDAGFEAVVNPSIAVAGAKAIRNHPGLGDGAGGGQVFRVVEAIDGSTVDENGERQTEDNGQERNGPEMYLCGWLSRVLRRVIVPMAHA